MSDIMTSLGITGTIDHSGIKASLLSSDGQIIIKRLGSLCFPYSYELRQKISLAKAEMLRLYHYNNRPPFDKGRLLRRLTLLSSKKDFILALSQELTDWLLKIARNLLKKENMNIDIAGFNGQPLLFKNKTDRTNPISLNLGNPYTFAEHLRTVISHGFAEDDISHEGKGAPLSPIYLQALLHFSASHGLLGNQQTLAIVDIQDITTITLLSPWKAPEAFESGPGTILLDEFTQRTFQKSDDNDGKLSEKGEAEETIVNKWLKSSIFSDNQKSFTFENLAPFLKEASCRLSPVDCLATLTAFTARSIIEKLNSKDYSGPVILVGRYTDNHFFKTLFSPFYNILSPDSLGWEPSFMESEQYALFAIRAYRNLPTSFPSTTGVKQPTRCGRITIPTSLAKERGACC